LVCAIRKIAANNIPYRVPDDAELPDRLRPVLVVIRLVHNEGHTSTAADTLVRRDPCDEAIRLARVLVQLMPDEPEAVGLLALMLLVHARSAARTNQAGGLVRLGDQDRTAGTTTKSPKATTSFGDACAAINPAPTNIRQQSMPSTLMHPQPPPPTGAKSSRLRLATAPRPQPPCFAQPNS
jgi:RNA polymerase sigma-70 factor, ECF subfamily